MNVDINLRRSGYAGSKLLDRSSLGWRLLAGASIVLASVGCAPRARPLGVHVLPEVMVTTNDLRAPRAQNSPDLAASPSDRSLLALANRRDSPGFNCALQVSEDRGRSWHTVNPVPKLPAGADTCYAPEVAFDESGTLFYLFVGLQGKGNEPMGAFLTSSSDQGRHFEVPVPVLGGNRFGVRMAIDLTSGPQGRIHLLWLEARGEPPIGGMPASHNPILSAYSDDGGLTFSDPVQVSDVGRAKVVAPALALGEDGAVHVLYYDLGEDDRDYRGL